MVSNKKNFNNKVVTIILVSLSQNKSGKYCHNKFGYLDKAHGAHAEKQVQVATEDTKQLFAAHLRFLAVLIVLCAVVAQRELHKRRVHVGGQIGDADLTRLDGAEVADAREDARVRVEVVERIFVAGDTFREDIF